MGLRVPGHTPADLFRMSAEGRLGIMDAAADSSRVNGGLDLLLQDYADLTGFGRFAWNPRYDIRLDRRLGRVTRPALVVGVDDDRVVPAAHVERYAQLLPNAKTTVIHGTAGAKTGHGVVIQEPDAVAAEIRTFTEGH
jgi:pimeloyl-ACP methyl ester carboxylesterase